MSRLFASTFTQLALIALSLLLLIAAPSAHAQWLVYETTFDADQDTSVNFSHYTGAYLIAPIHGGTSSLIFVTSEGGQFYAVAEDSARFFIAVNAKGRRAVFSAKTENGTALAIYQAGGPINSSITYAVPGQQRAEGIATTLTGQLMASDDESTTTTPAADGSLGMVGSAIITAQIRPDLSAMLNKHAKTMTDSVDMMAGLLEQIGYTPDDGGQEHPPADELPVALPSEAASTALPTAVAVETVAAAVAPAPAQAPASTIIKTSRGQKLSLPVTPGRPIYGTATTPPAPTAAPPRMAPTPRNTPPDDSNIDSRLFPPDSHLEMERTAARQTPQYHPYPDK